MAGGSGAGHETSLLQDFSHMLKRDLTVKPDSLICPSPLDLKAARVEGSTVHMYIQYT